MLFWYDSLCEAFDSVLNNIWILKLLYKSNTAYTKGIQVSKNILISEFTRNLFWIIFQKSDFVIFLYEYVIL